MHFNNKKYFSAVAFLLLLLVYGFSWGKYTSVSPEGSVVKLAKSEVSDGKAHYFSVKIDGKIIKFFLLMDNAGIIRAAFDACDVCYPAKKGYRQEGDFMVCNNCGQKFHESRINEVRGGCNPSPLDRKVEGGTVIINVSDLKKGSLYF